MKRPICRCGKRIIALYFAFLLGDISAVVFQKIPYEILVFSSEIHLQHQLTSDHVMPKSQLLGVNLAVLPINTKSPMIQVIRPFLIYAVVLDLHFVVVQNHFHNEQFDHQSRLLLQSLSDELLDIRLGNLYFVF